MKDYLVYRMENLFDVISPKLFSIFSRKDKRANYDLLSIIFDVFTKRERRQSIEKEELIEDLAAYIKGRKFEEFDNEDDESIENRSAHDKAMIKYRQFLKCGWLEEDRYGFTTMTSLKDNAITLLETFQNIIENRNRPLEYTGYFYIIYEALHSFEYSRSKALLEQIAKNTKELFNSLQGLSSSIKHFIES